MCLVIVLVISFFVPKFCIGVGVWIGYVGAGPSGSLKCQFLKFLLL